MSKKNNKDTKRRIHANCLAREKAEREKRERAQAKAQAKAEPAKAEGQGPLAAAAASAPASLSGASAATLGTLVSGGVAKKQPRGKKPRPLRIRRGAVVRGVRIRDADDKRRALKVLSAEAKLKERRAAIAAAAEEAAARAAEGAAGSDTAALDAATAAAKSSSRPAAKSLFGGVKRLKSSKGQRVAIIAGRKKVMVAKKPGAESGAGAGAAAPAAPAVAAAAAADAMME